MPAKALLMVEPTTFSFNVETAQSNFFQHQQAKLVKGDLRKAAITEFYGFVEILEKSGVSVYVKKHSRDLELPDGVFPNNWISFLPGGTVVIYPMLAENRRKEKDKGIIKEVSEATGYQAKKLLDLSYFEEEQKFLEGTGSIVFDHQARVAYASLSPRTNKNVLEYLCREIGYQYFIFEAKDRSGRPVYHTNVMLTITQKCAVVCLESITAHETQYELIEKLKSSGHEIVNISMDQMEAFAGNMLEVGNKTGASLLVMSETAYHSLEPAQRDLLELHHALLFSSIFAIEKTGGGSARCMMAEVFC